MPMAWLPDGRPFPQEYPTDPPSHGLNGAIYAIGDPDGRSRPQESPPDPPSHAFNAAISAIWGAFYAAPRERFDDAMAALVLNLHRRDTGSWSLYDLYPPPIHNWASLAYHELHAT